MPRLPNGSEILRCAQDDRVARDDWCRVWSETGAMHGQMGEKAEAEGYYTSAAYHYYHAAMAYHFGKFLFLQSPRELRAAHEHTVSAYKKALPYFDFPGEHVAI